MTDLAKGVVFGDKILSPSNGTAYNIKTGEAEWGPGMDNLPVFQTKVDEDEGKLYVYLPKNPPKRLRPYLYLRDFNDLRKVVIIGNGAAAITCAETLRQMEYTVTKYLI